MRPIPKFFVPLVSQRLDAEIAPNATAPAKTTLFAGRPKQTPRPIPLKSPPAISTK
jgi:hypothetical protein